MSKGALPVATTTQQRRHHTETESGYASLIGAGLLFMMLAFGLSAIFGGTPESSERFNLFLIGGVLAFIAFSVMWAFHLRPWRHFDDWKTPLYTGHETHGDAHAEVHAHEDEAHSQMVPSLEAEAHLADLGVAHQAETYSQVVPSAEAEAKFAALSTTSDATDTMKSVGATETDTSALTATPSTQETVSVPPEPVDDVIVENPAAKVESLPSVHAAGVIPASSRDDLQLIEGIGPKIAEALNNAGVLTFAQLADMTSEALVKIVRDAGVRMVGHGESWPQQARLAAEGKLEELKALQSQLNAGRR
jgi:predicted flap endonuclease-1-like 5' DNA nuclease